MRKQFRIIKTETEHDPDGFKFYPGLAALLLDSDGMKDSFNLAVNDHPKGQCFLSQCCSSQASVAGGSGVTLHTVLMNDKGMP